MIRLVIPGLPPSVNEAYATTVKKKGKKLIPIRMLSAKAKKYKREAAAHLVRCYPAELRFFQPDVPYGIAIQFAFTELENKTWIPKGPREEEPGSSTKGAKNRYKRVDVSNRLKIVEDVLSEVAAVDDSQNLTAIIDKCKHAVEETRIWVWNIVQEGEFPDAVINAIRGV